jgi:hypothetical protein
LSTREYLKILKREIDIKIHLRKATKTQRKTRHKTKYEQISPNDSFLIKITEKSIWIET